MFRFFSVYPFDVAFFVIQLGLFSCMIYSILSSAKSRSVPMICAVLVLFWIGFVGIDTWYMLPIEGNVVRNMAKHHYFNIARVDTAFRKSGDLNQALKTVSQKCGTRAFSNVCRWLENNSLFFGGAPYGVLNVENFLFSMNGMETSFPVLTMNVGAAAKASGIEDLASSFGERIKKRLTDNGFVWTSGIKDGKDEILFIDIERKSVIKNIKR